MGHDKQTWEWLCILKSFTARPYLKHYLKLCLNMSQCTIHTSVKRKTRHEMETFTNWKSKQNWTWIFSSTHAQECFQGFFKWIFLCICIKNFDAIRFREGHYFDTLYETSYEIPLREIRGFKWNFVRCHNSANNHRRLRLSSSSRFPLVTLTTWTHTSLSTFCHISKDF